MSEQLRTCKWPHVSSRELSEDSAGIRRWETFTHLLRLRVNSREKSSRREIFRNIQSLCWSQEILSLVSLEIVLTFGNSFLAGA